MSKLTDVKVSLGFKVQWDKFKRALRKLSLSLEGSKTRTYIFRHSEIKGCLLCPCINRPHSVCQLEIRYLEFDTRDCYTYKPDWCPLTEKKEKYCDECIEIYKTEEEK